MQKGTEQTSGNGQSQTGSWWRTQEMFLIQEIMGLIGKDLPLDKVLREILHLMSEMLGLNRGRIVLRDPAGDDYYIAHAYGLTREEMARGRYEAGEGITGKVIASGQLLLVQDIKKDPSFLGRAVPLSQLPEGAVSFIACPIKIEGSVAGALACHRILNRDRLLSDELTLMKIMATLIGQLLTLHERVERKTRELRTYNIMLKEALKAGRARYGIIGTSPALLGAIGQIEKVAAATASVLLLGESGTGKELFARALHLAGPRRDKPFIKVNCAAIPENLFESELFGHEKGAFTGAIDARAGWFEQAGDGTIFLDEIGELPLHLQTKLLRTLQEGTVTRLGAKKETRVNARLVAATNRDLATEVGNKSFREDLYYRLNVIPIRLPSLDQRPSDIPELTLFFVDKFNRDNQRNVSLSRAAIDYIAGESWPGNIRQLSNFIERLVLLAGKTVLDERDVRYFLKDYGPTPVMRPSRPLVENVPMARENAQGFRPYMKVNSHSRRDLEEALAAVGGNKTRAAQRLGMTERQFSYRWRKTEGA
ncbi:sigma 54-interacting transcriptional regulator [Agrobacterium radiobacter]|uniref:sigma 54-interacting transcriptional regulator n=1 Tax=Agrobacterium tumefaciens complex TaxID=1183400 RepID=UPI001CBC13C0|nr:sigma 54-interacting transcriptional regulator [Agrobacterium tumefaciens]